MASCALRRKRFSKTCTSRWRRRYRARNQSLHSMRPHPGISNRFRPPATCTFSGICGKEGRLQEFTQLIQCDTIGSDYLLTGTIYSSSVAIPEAVEKDVCGG